MTYPLAHRIIPGPPYTPALQTDIRKSIDAARSKHPNPVIVFIGRYSLGKVS